MNTKTRQRGFTLAEILIVIAILGILSAIGTTSLLNYLPNMRLRSAARDIYSAAMLAKTEAIRRGESVTLLFDSPGGSYTMFLDTDGDNKVDVSDETVLVSETALPPRISFDPSVDGDDGVTFDNNTLVFTMRGIPDEAGAGTVGLHATDGLGNTIRQRSIGVSSAGRINIQ